MQKAGWDDLFPWAACYRGDTLRPSRVKEDRPSTPAFPYRERHLQAVWFDPGLRPPVLRSREGEEIVVEDPGIWNLNAGPDFLGAVARVGPDRRRVAGDVEVHIHPQDWRRHGHARDPRYARVRFHVTYFRGPLQEDELPPGTLRITLRELLASTPGFSFETIDITAYPFAARCAAPPCQQQWRDWNAAEKQRVLDAAGQERLRRKAARLRQRLEEAGSRQALYEELMAGLGYQHNKGPFRYLAENVPLDALRQDTRHPGEALALLLGVAGLLPAGADPAWDGETREVFRKLWDAWWKRRAAWSRLALPRSAWQLRGRPANHPVRRLAAAALLFAGPDREWFPATATLEEQARWLQGVSDPYWDFRSTWGGLRSRQRQALIGVDRAHALLVNVLVPFQAAQGRSAMRPEQVLASLPRESSNQLLRQTAVHLFGTHHPVSLYATGLRQQGLLQIFHDYCLNDRSRCATCAFPTLLSDWKKTCP